MPTSTAAPPGRSIPPARLVNLSLSRFLCSGRWRKVQSCLVQPVVLQKKHSFLYRLENNGTPLKCIGVHEGTLVFQQHLDAVHRPDPERKGEAFNVPVGAIGFTARSQLRQI
ncbi:hypothetical protein EYF80_038866 [Liparis tanakae]|uniref:Uncharacterized protein n=1 Tax=Liparis tanakae TaxID=230148 RepID=A0A4Z2GDE6_9TELE|nr:hypothetical protein EYF80_038866 [Liparis tanakae]